MEFAVMSAPGRVWAWSVARLAFEPRGWQVPFRDELRQALHALANRPGRALLARYDAPDDDYVDVENVLLYNVGMSVFGPLLGSGLTCSRGRSADGRHHVRYEIVDDAPDPGGTEPVARVAADLGPALPRTAGQWWACLRPYTTAVGSPLRDSEWFTVDATVGGPVVDGRRVAGLIKPMLDGWISALHAHDGTDRDALLPRLAALGAPATVWAQLVDPCVAVLGTRRLLWPYRANLAWNPADHRCKAFRIRVGYATRWTLQAALRPAAPR